MFNFFKKKTQPVEEAKNNFEVELTASILAYEIARSDGDISQSELDLLLKYRPERCLELVLRFLL